jgi:hypothetical protein
LISSLPLCQQIGRFLHRSLLPSASQPHALLDLRRYWLANNKWLLKSLHRVFTINVALIPVSFIIFANPNHSKARNEDDKRAGSDYPCCLFFKIIYTLVILYYFLAAGRKKAVILFIFDVSTFSSFACETVFRIFFCLFGRRKWLVFSWPKQIQHNILRAFW